MQRRLTIIRHAKSDWSDLSLADIDRPLNARGRRDAPMMGQRLRERGDAPDLILSSPAARARATAEVLATALGYPLGELQVEKTIYAAPLSALVDVIRSCPHQVVHAMMVGHNPGSEDLVQWLIGEPMAKFVTCAVADLSLDAASWQALGPGTATLRSHWYPKMFTK